MSGALQTVERQVTRVLGVVQGSRRLSEICSATKLVCGDSAERALAKALSDAPSVHPSTCSGRTDGVSPVAGAVHPSTCSGRTDCVLRANSCSRLRTHLLRSAGPGAGHSRTWSWKAPKIEPGKRQYPHGGAPNRWLILIGLGRIRPDPHVALRMHLTRQPGPERHSQVRSISWAVSMKRRTSSTVAATSCLFTISLTVWT